VLSEAKIHAQIGNYPNINMKTCGLSRISGTITSRIVEGENASLGEFPWMVSLFGREQIGDQVINYYCGGALINQYWILTAANCFNHKKY